MMRWRTVAVVSSLALVAAAVGLPSAATAADSAAGTTGPAQTAACAAAPVGYSTCLVHVWHRAGSQGALSAPPNRLGTPSSSGSSTPSGYAPATITKAYGFSTTGGAGETIAIVDAFADATITTNLETFDSEYGLPCTSCFTKVSQTGGSTTGLRSTSGWDLEQSLDVEWAHALAPKARILLVEAKTNSDANLFAAVTYATKNAEYVSMSWGGTETSSETSYDSYFTKPGVSFFAAAGDTHSEVTYPSSSPDVISVGGTTLEVTSTGTWSSESAWSTGGGGCSRYETANPAQAAYPTYDQKDATCAGKRAAPDISLDANPSTGVAVYDTVKVTGLSGWIQVGGTSASTVMIASHAAETATQVDSALVYSGSLKIYNVASGSNGHTCVAGYNLCTGLGSWNTDEGTVTKPPTGSLSFTATSKSLRAGTSVELTVEDSSGQTTAVAITLQSSSAKGAFSAGGTTFASSLKVTIPPHETSATFYYEDKAAGSPILTASASGWTAATRSVTVTPGSLAKVTVSPSSVSLKEDATQAFTATGYDEYTNQVTSGFSPTWTSSLGTFSPSSGTSTTFTAGSSAGSGAVVAAQGSITGRATVTVTSEPSIAVTITAGSTTSRRGTYQVPLTVTATGTSGGISRASVSLDVYRGSCASGSEAATGTATANTAGTASFTFTTSTTGSYCAKATVTKTGYSTGSGTAVFSVAATGRAVTTNRTLRSQLVTRL